MNTFRAPLNGASKHGGVQIDAPMRWTGWFGLPVLWLAIHGALIWLARDPGILTVSDDATYLLLARSLKEGSYHDMLWDGAPLNRTYPPGFPALLALWTAIGGENFDWLVFLNVLVSTGTLVLVFLVCRRLLPSYALMAVMGILAVNPSLVGASGMISSEVPFTFCLMLVIWAATRLTAGTTSELVILTAAIAAPMMRAAGTPVPFAVVAWYAMQRRWPEALRASLASTMVIGLLLFWLLSPDPSQGSASYAADLQVRAPEGLSSIQVLTQRIAANARAYFTEGIPWLVPIPTIPGTIVDNVIGSGLLILCLIVGTMVCVRSASMLPLVLLACLSLLIVWVWFVPRFAVPLLPLLVPLFVLGLQQLTGRLDRLWANLILFAVTTGILGAASSRHLERFERLSSCERGHRYPQAACLTSEEAGFFEALRYVEDSLPVGELVLSGKASTVTYYTGHHAVSLSSGGVRFGGFERKSKELGIKWILLSSLATTETRQLAPLLMDNCVRLRLVKRFPPTTYLFAWNEHEAATGNNACEAINEYLNRYQTM